MSGLVKSVWNWSKRVAGGVTGDLAKAYKQVTGIGTLQQVTDKGLGEHQLMPLGPPGSAPTIDQAAQNLQESDRIRRRRGVLANIYGGGSDGSSASVGTKQLLGQ